MYFGITCIRHRGEHAIYFLVGIVCSKHLVTREILCFCRLVVEVFNVLKCFPASVNGFTEVSG